MSLNLMRRDLLSVLSDLPERVFVGPTNAGKLAIGTGYCIHRGMRGYTPMPSLTDAIALEWNERAKVTPAQMEAMQVGSMFGWDVPGADPMNCDGRGF